MKNEFQKSIAVSPLETDFSPVLYAGKLDKGIPVIADIGFDAIELSVRDPDEKIVKDVLKIVSDYGLKVSTVATGQSYYNDGISLSDKDEGRRKLCVSRLIANIDLASSLSSFVIIGGIRGGGFDSQRFELPRYAESFKKSLSEIIPHAKKKNVILLLEPINRYETMLVNNIAEALEWLNEIGSNNLKVLPDTFHMNIEESSMEEGLRIAGDYLGYIHFADSNRLAPGWGHINFKKIASVLKEVGYQGFIGFEILPRPNDYKAAMQAKKYIESLLGEGEDRE